MSRLLALLLAAAPVTAVAHDVDRAAAERVDVLELDAAEGDAVRMRSSNGALEVVVDPSVAKAVLTVEVTANSHRRADAERDLEKIDVVFERQGGVIVAEVDVPRGVHSGAHLRLVVPGANAADLDTDNGGVEVIGVQGDVLVNTDNGGVEVRDVTGRITVRTRNGGVEVSDPGGHVDVETSNGRVQVWDAGGSVSATSNNGSIDVRLRPDAGGPVTLVTSNGSVELEVGPGFSGRLHTDTSLGSVRVHDRSGRAVSNGDVWVIGEGGESSRVQTSMGSVSVDIGG